MSESSTTKAFLAADYDLDATLTSGQAFRWSRQGNIWNGVLGSRWVQLHADAGSIIAETAIAVRDWDWLTGYLQLNVDLSDVLRVFPDDEPMRAAARACRGLRLLRQEHWECLA